MPNLFFDVRANRAAAISKHSASPNIWYDCPFDDIRNGSISGLAYFNDWDLMPLIGTQTTQIGYMDGKVFATSSSNVQPTLTVNSVDLGMGIVQFLADTSAHSASFAIEESYKIPGANTAVGKLWFEARIAVNTVAVNRANIMVGLAETSLWTLATGVPFSSNAGAITNSASFIGFEKLAGDTTQLHTAYSDRATSFTEVGTNQGTLAANTFTNVGFTYDPNDSDNTRRIRFYQDNLELTTAISQTTIAGFTNLNAHSLGLIAACMGGSSTTSDSLFIDSWRVAQLLAPTA
jgi:hypothetical protein